jgi:hypothetical protein
LVTTGLYPWMAPSFMPTRHLIVGFTSGSSWIFHQTNTTRRGTSYPVGLFPVQTNQKLLISRTTSPFCSTMGRSLHLGCFRRPSFHLSAVSWTQHGRWPWYGIPQWLGRAPWKIWMLALLLSAWLSQTQWSSLLSRLVKT